MKIVMHSLEQIAHVELFATIGFLIFFIFFLWMGYSVYKTPKSYVEEMSRLPLEGDDDDFSQDKDSK
jgi:cbb3-type cytochrome oxidase subunit 3